MMRLFSFMDSLLSAALLALTAVLLAGCATSRPPATELYKQAQNETVYRARAINLGTMFPTGGLSRDPSVALRSWATCSGENCQPRRAWFSFEMRGGGGESRVLSSRDVQIRTEGNVHEWPEERQRTTGESDLAGSGSTGELVRIRMSLSTLRDIAQSQRMSGTLGDEEFSLSYEERAPLRSMLEKASGAGESE